MTPKMRMALLWLGLGLAPLLVPMSAAAQTTQQIAACNGGPDTPADQQIAGCSAVIAANNFGGQNLAVAFRKRCLAHAVRNEAEPAIADCTRAIESNPLDIGALYARGSQYEGRAEYDQATQDYDRVLAIDRLNVDAFSRRGWVAVKQKQYDRAIEDLSRALEANEGLDTNSATTLTIPTSFGNRCWARALAKQFEAALADCNTAINLELSVGLIDDRGFVYYQMGKFDNAITQYTAALRVDPASAASLFGRGLAKLKNHDTAGGNADLAAARAIQPDIAEQLGLYGLQ